MEVCPCKALLRDKEGKETLTIERRREVHGSFSRSGFEHHIRHGYR